MYSIKEIFYSLQGEGFMAGRAGIFCRFSGCNLWSGLEKHRANAICQFCDTDFIGTNGANGNKYTTIELAKMINKIWQANTNKINMTGKPYVILTGGEPLLQVDQALIDELHKFNFEVAIETNGTQNLVQGIDWVCVSPKFGSKIVLTSGDEIKIVYPQNFTIKDYEYFALLKFKYFFIQPKYDKDQIVFKLNTNKAIEFCKTYPKWYLSMQTHKYLGIA